MKAPNQLLFAAPALIWGSTWFAITFQLGEVPPLFSIAYRFLLSGVVLLAYARVRRLDLRFSWEQHGWIALQGLLLFGFNYWAMYEAEHYLTSGLVAVVFSTLIFLNMLFGTLLLGNPLRKRVLAGALLGLLGTTLIFRPEVTALNFSDAAVLGLTIGMAGVVSASLGNITSARNQRQALPVVPTTAFGMLYGGTLMFGIALVLGEPLVFGTSAAYLLSLAYLVVFGSVIAFGSYLTLIGRIGPDQAAYVAIFTPVIALLLSFLFEGYQPTGSAGVGVLLIVVGSVVALRR